MIQSARVMAIFATGLLALAANAQDQPAAPKAAAKPMAKKAAAPAMPMPKPAPEMAALKGLVGTWTSEETYEKTPFLPNGGKGSGTNTIRLGPGGFSVLMDVRSKNPMGPFSGHGVLTWDTNAKAYSFYWADSMDPGVVTESGKDEGGSLVLTGEHMMMGKTFKLKDVIADRTPTSYTMTSYMDDGSGGGEMKFMTIKFSKKEAAAPAAKKEADSKM